MTRRPWWQPVLEAAAILAFFAQALMLGAELLRRVEGGGHLAVLPLAVAAGYLAADFASGLVHWFCDTFFEEVVR